MSGWLYNKDITYNRSQAFAVIQFRTSADVNKFLDKCLNPNFEGILADTNLGDYVLRFYSMPVYDYAIPRETSFSDGLFVRNTSFTGFNCAEVKPTGYYNLGEFFYSAEDYTDFSTYTSMQVFLPYYGFVDVNPDDVANKYIRFRVSIDYTTGVATYYIAVSSVPTTLSDFSASDNTDIERIITTVTCNVGIDIPFTATNANEKARNAILSTISTGLSIASTLYTGIPIAGAVAYSTQEVTTTQTRNPATGRLVTSGRETSTYERKFSEREQRQYVGNFVSTTMSDTIQTLGKLRYRAETSTNLGSQNLINASTSIRIVIKKAKVVPQSAQFNHLFGKPLGETRLLSTLHGYTQISNIHFESALLATATEEEKAMLKEACLQGIYL